MAGAKLRGKMSQYFEIHWQEYRKHIDNAQNSKAIDEALKVLSERKKASPNEYKKDHKGTPFYVLGYAAFSSHDYSSASLYFDAAVEADLTYHGGKLNTPALRFIQLLPDDSNPVLASGIISKITSTVEQLVQDYNSRAGSVSLTLDELRSRFFLKILQSGSKEQRALLTAFISFAAEWQYRNQQIDLVQSGSREPFFLHIFRGCLLFESLLKVHDNGKTLNPILHSLASRLGISSTSISTRENQFDNVLAGISTAMPIEDAINSCVKARNTAGHNIVWTTPSLQPETYDLLIKNVSASCLHAISKLYV
ncbi:MAG: hypothetical protein IPK23_08895 [Rhizobiales bacterium]|nr:hypothetical protein [Hyphomicrobiales bacterium]